MTPEATIVRVESPSSQAFQILHIAFSVVPIVAGIDKFFHFLVNWDLYLAPLVPRVTGFSAPTLMLGAGLIEVIAGLLVVIAPRLGAMVVGLWLCGVVVNLLLTGAYFDIALRDFALALGAFALSRLSMDYSDV
jgi:hypothetical protein